MQPKSEEEKWYHYYTRDFSERQANLRPIPLKWSSYYLQSMDLSERRGKQMAEKSLRTINDELNESLTTLSELVLSEDIDTTKYYLENESQRGTPIEPSLQPTLIHFAVTTRNVDMVLLLLNTKNGHLWVNERDPVTLFTPLHLAFFFESIPIIQVLLSFGADIECKDGYNGTPLDYGRMLGFVERKSSGPNPPQQIKVFCEGEIEHWGIKKVESVLGISFTTGIICDHDFIHELMFSSLQITPDLEFRDKYDQIMNTNSGDEWVVLAWVDEKVGWGVFADRDFEQGEYIMRYGGKLTKEEEIGKNNNYNVMVSFEGFGLDASFYRNSGGMINHSTENFNAETQCIFEKGAEQVLITATEFIPKRKQILINYNDSFWEGSEIDLGEMVQLGGKENVFPNFLPEYAIKGS